jgi:hypothetical protein
MVTLRVGLQPQLKCLSQGLACVPLELGHRQPIEKEMTLWSGVQRVTTAGLMLQEWLAEFNLLR